MASQNENLSQESFWEDSMEDDSQADKSQEFWDDDDNEPPLVLPEETTHPPGAWTKQRIETEYTFDTFLKETQELSKELEKGEKKRREELEEHTANEEYVRNHNEKLKERRVAAEVNEQANSNKKLTLRKTGKRKSATKPGCDEYKKSLFDPDETSEKLSSDQDLEKEKYRAAVEYTEMLKEQGYFTLDKDCKKQSHSQRDTDYSHTKMLKLENGGKTVLTQGHQVEESPKKKSSGMEYIADTIPWRYRQNPCPGELCSRDRGHHGFCVIDMRYKLGLDLTGKEVYTYIYKEKQRHQQNIEKFWTMADDKSKDITKEADKIRQQVQSDKTKLKLKSLLKRDSAKLRKKIKELQSELVFLEERLDDCDYSIAEELDTMADKCKALGIEFDFELERIKDKYESATHVAELQLKEKVREYETFMLRTSQVLVCPFWVLRNRRAKPTSKDWLDTASVHTTHRNYRARETNMVMEYIHGSTQGALYGARLYLQSHAEEDFWEEMLESYKRGKFLQKRIERVTSGAANPQDMMHKAIAQIYMGHLSRRKYSFITKLNDSYYDPERKKWVRRKVKVGSSDIRAFASIPYSHIEQFVKRLNMGRVVQVPNHMGVTRTLTSLVLMIIDLNLKVPHLRENIIWFNEREYHFVMQFSDDGAPETKELTMSIGTLTCWNLGQKIRSRELQYFLHGLSVPEKAAIMADLWQQHTSEMQVMEGNIYNLHGHLCSLTFEPCADMAWQSWAANETTQSATYFSPYGNVSTRDMATVNGSLGEGDGHTWQPWTIEQRVINAGKLQDFIESQDKSLPEDVLTLQRREFLIRNKMRQLGKHRIGKYVSQLRPEPMHSEINAWQYLLNMVYREAARRNTKNSLLAILAAPIANRRSRRRVAEASVLRECVETAAAGEARGGDGDFWQAISEDPLLQSAEAQNPSTIQGCGIPALAKQIVAHEQESNNRKRLNFRLIGPQTIALARNWHRVCMTMKTPDETPRDRLLRMALYKTGLCLREAASIFQSTTTDEESVLRVQTLLRLYFNLHVLFFGPNSVSVTTWSMAYALPYHMKKLYDQYRVGYGITSMQSREAENAGIKLDLARTNRSRDMTGVSGKWWQVCRWNYVRTFYLPEHHPVPSNYKACYESRVPTFLHPQACKQCGEILELGEDCEDCDSDDMLIVTQCAIRGTLTPQARWILHQEAGDPNNPDYADSMVTSEAHTDILRDMDNLLQETEPFQLDMNEDPTINKTAVNTDPMPSSHPTSSLFDAAPQRYQQPGTSSAVGTGRQSNSHANLTASFSAMRAMDPAIWGDVERDSIFGGAYKRATDGSLQHTAWPESEGVRMRDFDDEGDEDEEAFESKERDDRNKDIENNDL